MPPPESRLLVEERDGLRLAGLVSGKTLIDLAADRLGRPRRYQSIWQVKIDRILPHVGAFADLGGGSGLLRGGSHASGDKAIVQVKSLRAEGKADILTEDIALPGAHFVYLPRADKIAVSRRLEAGSGDAVLAALNTALHAAGIAGGILRTGAAALPVETVVAEAEGLRRRWLDIEQRARTTGADLLEEGPDAGQRLAGDYPAIDFTPEETLSEVCGLEDGFGFLLDPEIRLPRGGTVMIEETSALTAIDVNAGTRAPADVDRDAVPLIARHIRLRNLSGLILIDFAAAASKKSGAAETAILHALRRALADDPAGCRVAGLTATGLVELTRPARCLPFAETVKGWAGA